MPLDVSSSPLFNITEHAKQGHSTADVRILADTLMRYKAVHVDPAEFACLKAIVLFRAGASMLLINIYQLYILFSLIY